MIKKHTRFKVKMQFIIKNTCVMKFFSLFKERWSEHIYHLYICAVETHAGTEIFLSLRLLYSFSFLKILVFLTLDKTTMEGSFMARANPLHFYFFVDIFIIIRGSAYFYDFFSDNYSTVFSHISPFQAAFSLDGMFRRLSSSFLRLVPLQVQSIRLVEFRIC